MASVSAFQRMRGQAKNNLYPQPEGTLGEFMLKHGADLGEASLFGKLIEPLYEHILNPEDTVNFYQMKKFNPFPNDKIQTFPHSKRMQTTILNLMKVAVSSIG